MSSRWKLALAIAAVAALAVASRVLPVEEWLKAFQGRVAGMGALGGLAYGAVYVVAALLFVPGALLTVGAGLLFGLVWGTIVVSAASTVTAALAFLVGRYLARARFERLAKRNDRFRAIDEAIRDKGWKVVLLLRLSPLVPFSVSNYLYGITPVPFVPYLLASWAGMIPGTVLYVYLGAAGAATAGGARRPEEWALLAAGLVATAVVTIILTRAARQRLKKARS